MKKTCVVLEPANLRAPQFKGIDDKRITYEYCDRFRPSRESRGDVWDLWEDVDDLPSLVKKLQEMVKDMEDENDDYDLDQNDVLAYIQFVLGFTNEVDTCILEHC